MGLESGQINTIVNSLALLCILFVLVRHQRRQTLQQTHQGVSTCLGCPQATNLRGDLGHGEEKSSGRNEDLESNNQCLSLDLSLPELVGSTDQVLILTPPNAAGTSLEKFAGACTKEDFSGSALQHPDIIEHLLIDTFETPKVLASHFLNPDPLIHLAKTTPRNTLTIYVHRSETSRIQSAIKYVLVNRGCMCVASGQCEGKSPIEFEKVEGKDCYVTEDHVHELLRDKEKRESNEIGGSIEKLLTCNTYETIEEYAPTMLFMDYKKASELQDVLAEKYCPELVDHEIEINVASKKDHHVHVMTNTTHTVPIEEWLEAKSSLLELALGLNNKATCMAKTRNMEDMLNSCQDGFLSVKGLKF